MRASRDKDLDPAYVAQRLRQQYGDQALKALHQMTFSKERRGAAKRKAMFEEVAEILMSTQGQRKAGGVVDVNA
ncbi:MAG: hypothetical protein AAF337_06455 [Pseudomonadota bacterium]